MIKFRAKPIIHVPTENNNICTKSHSAGFETISIWKATNEPINATGKELKM